MVITSVLLTIAFTFASKIVMYYSQDQWIGSNVGTLGST